MKACLQCGNGLTLSQDDGLGRHKDGCPRVADREAYLARRRERMPEMVALQEHLRAGGAAEDLLTGSRDPSRLASSGRTDPQDEGTEDGNTH